MRIRDGLERWARFVEEKNKELRRKWRELEDDGRVKAKKLMEIMHNWTVEDRKPKPPKQIYHRAVKDRADQPQEMAEDGMTFMGAIGCIFTLMKSLRDYDLGAAKDDCQKSKEFDDWVGYSCKAQLSGVQFVFDLWRKLR